jgi:hypothetical protein
MPELFQSVDGTPKPFHHDLDWAPNSRSPLTACLLATLDESLVTVVAPLCILTTPAREMPCPRRLSGAAPPTGYGAVPRRWTESSR